jgi:hypothetical protein
MYSISAALSLKIGVQALRDDFSAHSCRRLFTEVTTAPIVLIGAIIWVIAASLFKLLPAQVKQALALALSYTGKWFYYAKSTGRVKLRQLSWLPRRRAPKVNESDQALSTFLFYDMVILIARHVHYVDLVNLSLVSKRMRVTVFPSLPATDQNGQLRRYSCFGKEKNDCWGCGIQICRVSLLISVRIQTQ